MAVPMDRAQALASKEVDLIRTLIMAGIAVLVTVLATQSGQAIVVFVLIGIMVLLPVIFFRWPDNALAVLFVAVAVPRVSLKILGLNMKVEHAVAGLIAMGVLIGFKTSIQKLRLVDYLLISFLFVTLFSSAFCSPEPATTLKNAVIFSLAVLCYWLPGALIRDADGWRRAMLLFLAVGTAEALFGILCFGAHRMLGTTLGITYYSYLDALPAVHGSQWEPNIFGSYVSAFTAIFLFLYLQNKETRGWYLGGMIITGLAALLSLARASWIGFVVAALIALFWRSGSRSSFSRTLMAVLIFACIGGFAFISASRIGSIRERVGTLAPDEVLDDPTLVHRLLYINFAMQDIAAHPWLGTGSDSFGLLWNWETEEGTEPAWVGNIFVRIWHDSGLIGLALFLGFVGALGLEAWKYFKAQRDTPIGRLIGALLVGSVVLVVAFQATEASTLAWSWVYLGLLGAFVSISRKTAESIASRA